MSALDWFFAAFVVALPVWALTPAWRPFFRVEPRGPFRWWTVGRGVDGTIRWLKLGPVTFAVYEWDGRMRMDVTALNRWVRTLRDW